MHSLFLLELVIFSGSALAIGIWELWRTDKAIRKRKAEEAAASDRASSES
ncbi:MAG: hypothetical protein ACK4HR_05840 [Hyphomonas sp.]|jgi:uncharacterized membrane protein YidH (DUF202 family)